MSSITTAFNTVSDILRPIGISLHLLIDAAEIITEEDVSKLQVASLISRCAILALNIFSLSGSKMNLSTKTMLKIKAIEFGARVIDVPVQFIKDNEKLGQKAWTLDGFLQIISQGGISPLLGCLSTAAEMGVYREKRMLEKLKQNPDATRPIYIPDEECDGSNKLVGYKKIDAQECEKTIALFNKIKAGLNVGEMTSQTAGLVARVTLFIKRQLLAQVNQRVNEERELHPDIDPSQNPIEININEQTFFLEHLAKIPSEFHDDEIFERYTCDIGYEPIRYIVQDPTSNGENPVFYEKAVIETWLAKNPTSPTTRLPLTSDQLIARADLQSVIDKRLSYYANVSLEVFTKILGEKPPFNQVRGV